MRSPCAQKYYLWFVSYASPPGDQPKYLWRHMINSKVRRLRELDWLKYKQGHTGWSCVECPAHLSESENSVMSLLLTVLSLLQRATSLVLFSGSNERVAAAWYTGWHATEGFPLSNISWDKYNTLIYSFA